MGRRISDEDEEENGDARIWIWPEENDGEELKLKFITC